MQSLPGRQLFEEKCRQNNAIMSIDVNKGRQEVCRSIFKEIQFILTVETYTNRKSIN